MTLKYESEILFDLMKRDGDDAPSDVLPYESELKEKYLQQVEGAYPKLMDYRPEWLNYNLNAHLPADFPVETLSNVTEATVDNVVPYAYGSASLKGQTLVNLLGLSQWGEQWGEQGKITLSADSSAQRIDLVRNFPIKTNTKYLTIIPIYENTINHNFTIGGWGYFTDLPKITKADGTGIIKIIKTTKDVFSDNIFYLELWKENTSGQITFGKPMFIEYQDGMENWDIPYFEGMQSVQMPVLTTTGKNLFNKETIQRNARLDTSTGLVLTTTDNNCVSDFISIKPDTKYHYYYGDSYINRNIIFYDINKNMVSSLSADFVFTFTSPTNAKYLRVNCFNGNLDVTQLEEGTTATSYEPYKSNILTVNEEVELHGIGDVKDELDLQTGKLTQRIGLALIDGTVDGGLPYGNGDPRNGTICLEFSKYTSIFKDGILKDSTTPYISEQLPYRVGIGDEGVYIAKFSEISSSSIVRVPANTYNEALDWLKNNPVTFIYELETPIVKTVDLTVTDQDGNTTSIIRPIEGTMHVSTSSQTLPPLLDMSVPVEATTQNLMSFVNIGEEE